MLYLSLFVTIDNYRSLIGIMKVFKIVNIALLAAGIFAVYVHSILWLGSKEEYDNIILSSQWSFIVNKLILGLIICAIVVAFIYVIGLILLKKHNAKDRVILRKVIILDFVLLLLANIASVLYQHL